MWRFIRSGSNVFENANRRRSSSWGQDDIFFTRERGEAYLKDLPHAEMYRLDSGHFAVEDCLDQISTNMHRFYREKVGAGNKGNSAKQSG
jgi:hypothetical protein